MNLCSITPISKCELMYENPTVMLLAHLSKKYPNYVKEAISHNNYKIMDNSIIELGDAFSMEELVKEAIKCNVDEIILPDVFQDEIRTLREVRNGIIWLKEHNLIGRFKLMAVCHGKNKEDFEWLWRRLNLIPEIDVIGVPKVVSTWSNRWELVKDLSTNKEIHFLGIYRNMRELLSLPKIAWDIIRSVDSCIPSLLAIQNKDFDMDRNGTIDLEKSELDVEKYHKIMEDFEKCL